MSLLGGVVQTILSFEDLATSMSHNQFTEFPMNTIVSLNIIFVPVIVMTVPPASDPELGVTELTKTP